jgi:CHASE1-domain containing sensor protein
MRRIIPILLAVLALVCSSLACAALSTEMSLENLRMAHDSDATQLTSTFSPSDIFYAVADLSNAPQGTVVKAVWTAVDVVDTEAGLEFQEQTLEISEESFSGTIYFELSNDDIWPAGRYSVNLYLNDAPVQSIEFDVE